MRLLDFLVGRELANSEAEQDKMTTLEGLPAIGLDGLASSAYGPEAALAILAPLGALGANWLAPITLAILLVLAMLFVSYWQTICRRSAVLTLASRLSAKVAFFARKPLGLALTHADANSLALNDIHLGSLASENTLCSA